MHNPLEPPERPSGATESPLRTDSSGRCLHDLVWAQAAACPDAVAVWSRGGELTYGELRRRALAIAGRLQQRGVGPGDRVGLAVARGPELVPAMLGIISAGAAWVGVDLGQPRARLSWLIEDAQLRAVVSDSAGDGALGGGGPERVSASASGATPDYVAPRVGPDHIATLIYTSGSTGQPKGALLTHAGLVNLVEGWAREPGLGAGDRMLGLSSVAFDMSILDVFLPLSVGATVVLVDRETTPDGAALARLAEQRAVTFILATPSTWRLLLAGDFRPPGRLVGVAGGEVLTPDLADRLIALGVELYNGYGVSEASACSCLWRVTSGRAPVPIGRPAPGVRVDLLDPSGNPVGDGEIGELWISGVGVARGYHRRPDLTAACFTEDPSTPGRLRYRTGDRARCEPDGLLTLHGRDDDQVKVRGHRVELGEVEAALLASPHIGEACVVPAESASGDTHLVAFIVCEPNAPLDLEAQTLATLAATLPSAFIPASIHRADSLPRNSSGKVDRRALQAATARRPGSLGPPVPPAAGLEGEIASLVAQILGLPLVGATDRFVALGGASLAATRLVQQLRGTLGLAVPLVRVLEDGSPRALLAASVKVVADSAPTLARDAGLPLSPEQAQLWFIASLAPGATAYHTALEAELDGPLDLAALTRAWALLALRHEVLRSRWVGSPAGPVQYVDSAPRGALAVHDLSDLPVAAAESRAVELARSIHAEPFDLAAGHVIRGAVLRFAPERHRLLACIHHIAFDGASLAVLQRDLAALYAHALGLAAAPPPLEAQVADLAARDGRAAADTQALAAFWRERLRDLPPVQALPGAVAVASARTDTAASWPLRVDAPTAAAVTTLAGEVGATPFAVLLSALAALLRRETGQGDLAVGTLLSAREQSGADGLIGHLARTLVLRLDATGEPDFRTLTQRTRDRVLEAMAHAELPFDQVVTAVGRTRHGEEQPLFQTVFAWQDPPPEAARVGGLAIHASEAFHGAAPFDLLVQCWPDGDGYAGSLVHRTDRLPLDAGEALARRFEAAVASLAADPAGPAFAANGDHLSAERALRGRPGIDDAVIGPRPRPDGTVEQVAWVLGPGAEAAGSPTGPVLVTVARIPLLADGQPDRALLAAHAAPEPARDPALHLDDLLGAPAPPAAAPPAPPTATSPAATARSARPALREGPPLRLPDDAPRDLPAVLRRAARLAPSRGALHIESDGSERFVSWPELLAQAESVASALQRAGMHPGDPILLVSDRSADFLAGLWGAFLAGVVPVPLPSAPRWEAWGGAAQRLLGVFELLDGPPIMLGGDTARALQDSRAALGLSDARLWPIATLSAAPGAYAPPPLAPDAPAIFLLTSGSTGRPKAVTHVQSTVIAMLHAYGERHAFGPDEVFLNWLGLDHVAPLFMVHLSAVWHAAAHVNAPAARFSADPALALDWASRFGATSTFVANFAFGLMADAAADAPPGRWDLSRFRVLANGGETIVARTARRFVATLMPHGLPAHAMVPIWGMSETGSATITALDFTLETIDDADQFVPIGDPVAGFGMRVVDPSGALVSEGEIGHLHVRGAQLHRGYHRRPDADRESFTDDGWFDTGDLAFIDARGMHIAGRAKDLIIISGVNIYAHDVEAAVESLPGIAPSFVAACPVRPAGADTDGLAIFFSPEDPDEAGLADLCAQVRGAVSRAAGVGVSYLLPVGRSAIPKTEIGKIQRAILRRRLESGEFDALHRRVEALCHGRRTTPDWFFEPVWRRRPVTPALEGPTGLLVLGGPSAPSVQDGACAVRWVNDSGALSGPESFDADALTGAARDFFASAGPRPAVVLRARRGPAPSSPDALHAEALRRSATLVALAAALDLTATPSVRLLVETCRAIRVREGEGGSVAEAPLLGLLASLRHEQPGHAFIHLDHDADSPDADWRIVESELAADPRGELEVAHRGGSRLVRRLRRVAFGAEPAAPRPADAPAPTRWLLTGGLGGVGQVLALRLLERPDTRLLIVGRRAESELPSEAAAALASLRGTGATARDVSYVALDIAEPGALAAAVAQQETAWGAPLQAVAHLAALMGSCLVARTGEADLRASLRPRLLGTLAAAALLDERPDAAFFDHTSVNGLFGGFGAGAYAAGCRVGEAVVATLRARGRRASSVAWSLWEDRGVTQGLPVESLAQRRGYTPIDARRGADAMSVAMRYAPASWLVGLDPRALPIRRLLDAGPVTPAPPAGVASPTATGHPAVGRGGGASDLTQRRLAAIWRDLLGVQHLGIDDTFFDLGGHSLLLAKLQARVEADFGRTTPLMVLFEQPTIRKQAAWLEAGGDTDPTAPSPPPDDQALARAVQRRQALGRPRPGRRS